MNSRNYKIYFSTLLALTTLSGIISSCTSNEESVVQTDMQWIRETQNPVFRDVYSNGSYESASDGHIFYDDAGNLRMIYSGDVDDNSSIKMTSGTSVSNWGMGIPLLSQPNENSTDVNKETAFYRKADDGKHQMFYIGYEDSESYQSQIFLAESDNPESGYEQIAEPVVPRGTIAGKSVYCITSPSVVEHEGALYMTFIGWNNRPNDVTEIWQMGAVSNDDGYTWSDFQLIETPIAAEGQLTKTPDGDFVAVRTDEYRNTEAIFYATSTHPFGPWTYEDEPIIVMDNSILEKDEVIAPQITFNPQSGEEHLFYTGADYDKGWWMMLAEKPSL